MFTKGLAYTSRTGCDLSPAGLTIEYTLLMRRLLFHALSRRRVQHHLAITRLGPHAVTFEHTHDFPELFLVISGAGVHERNGIDEPLEPGALTFVMASDTHRYRTAAGSLSFYNLALEAKWWADFSALAWLLECQLAWYACPLEIEVLPLM